MNETKLNHRALPYVDPGLNEDVLWNCEANLDDYIKNHRKYDYTTVLYFSKRDATSILKIEDSVGHDLKKIKLKSDISVLIYQSWNEFESFAGYQAGGKDGLTMELQCSQGMFYAECFFDDNYEKYGIAWQHAECLPELEQAVLNSMKTN